MNNSVLVVPPEDEPPGLVPPDVLPPGIITPLPEPVLSLVPSGKVIVAPSVENTTFPFLSVRYTVTPAEESLANASDVGWP